MTAVPGALQDRPEARVGYLIPEFPGQTHIWMWREIEHLRDWGVDIRIFSTRRPPARDAARHSFAEAAASEAIFLWPPGIARGLVSLVWALLRHPLGFAQCVGLAFTLAIDRRPAFRSLLPLVLPACIMAREAERGGLRHLHIHSCANAAVLGMMLKRLTGIPYSMTLNANLSIWGGALARKFGESAFTVVITEWMLAEVRRDYPQLRPNQAFLGRIGVDVRKWVPRPHQDERGPGPIRLVSVARLHRSKGHDVLIRAVEVLLGQGFDVTLTLVGDGPARTELEAQAAAVPLRGCVRFAGSLGEEAVIDEIRRADAFVLASRGEPLGVAYMEAMALQIPTIGTAGGGVAEIITDGVDGLLVPVEDAEALAAAIRRLAGDVALRRRLAEAGRRTIVEKFDSRHGALTLFRGLFGRDPNVSGLAEPAAAGESGHKAGVERAIPDSA